MNKLYVAFKRKVYMDSYLSLDIVVTKEMRASVTQENPTVNNITQPLSCLLLV